MRIFIAGIMQGSHRDAVLHVQDYREQLSATLGTVFPEAEIYDPFAGHASSLDYDDNESRDVFLAHNRLCREVDLLVAYVPHASMGTAIEMWEAYQHGVVVVAISPLEHNWAIRFTSHLIVESLQRFSQFAASGELKKLFLSKRAK